MKMLCPQAYSSYPKRKWNNAILMSLYDARTFVPSTTSPYGFIFTITTLPSFSFVMELEEETNYTDNILR
jgi:hypothetical protein